MHPLATRLAPLALLAGAGIAFAGWTAYQTTKPHPIPPLAMTPSQGPWNVRVAASGLIEGQGEDTVVGVPEAALVSTVAVKIGQRVRTGDLLLRLDDRIARAELTVAQAQLAAAQAQLTRLESMPRAEDAEPFAARVQVAEAQFAETKVRRVRVDQLFERNAVSADEVDIRRSAEAIAKANLASARADLDHVRLKAWEPDLISARAEVARAEAQVESARVRIARLEIRSPRDATITALNVAVGNLAAPGDTTLMTLADLDHLLVRVEIDESQVWKFRPGAAGKGWLRGDTLKPVDLVYERTEPSAAARRSIPGKPGERLDSRAMQVLYRLVDPPAYLRPGLLLEVDLEGSTAPAPTRSEEAAAIVPPPSPEPAATAAPVP